MSTLDINKVVTSLGSSKIKDRNDALTLLETLCNSKFKLNSKQFKSLIQGIFELIEHEANIYLNNKSGPVETRLSRASSSLKAITEKAIEDTKIQLKYKTYLKLIESIIENFYIDDLIIEPCALDFVTTITQILEQDFFKQHLTLSEWRSISSFIKKIIKYLLDETDWGTFHSNNNEKLLIQLFESLQSLYQCQDSISVIYLQLIQKDNHEDILYLVEGVIRHFKTENSLIVIVSRIINKLIMILSTENFVFVNKLIQAGLSLFLSFYQTPWQSLQIQFLLFLNFTSTHRFITLEGLPKIAHDSGDSIDGSDNGDLSIRSQSQSAPKVSLENPEVFLYNIRMLIENVLTKLNSPDYKFDTDDFGLVHTTNHRESWFKLKSIYLKSSNVKPWLLASGLAKLLDSFFTMKASYLKTFQSNLLSSDLVTADIFGGSILTGSMLGNPRKRQKLSLISDSVQSSSNVLEFCNRLIGSKTDQKFQQIGLQILLFHIESTGSPRTEVKKPDSKNLGIHNGHNSLPTSPSPNGFDSDFTHPDFEETTFEIPISSTDFVKQFDMNVIFKNVLSTFDNSTLHFWSLLACKAIINNHIHFQRPSKMLHSRYFFQLLKITLQFLKQQELSQLSSNLIYSIITCHENEDLSRLIDKSIITQLDNLSDLSEINGPYSICNESFQLWYSIHKVTTSINLSKRYNFAVRIQSWLISKWEVSFDKSQSNLLYSNSGLPGFIAWLCGISVAYEVPHYTPNLYNGALNEIYELQQTSDRLESFVVSQSGQPHEQMTPSIQVEPLHGNEQTHELLDKILESVKSFSIVSLNQLTILQWAIMIQRIGFLLKGQSSFKQMSSSFDYQSTAIFESFKEVTCDPELSFDLCKLLNGLGLNSLDEDTKCCLSENFPYERFLFVNDVNMPYTNMNYNPQARGASVQRSRNSPFENDLNGWQSEKDAFEDEFRSVKFQEIKSKSDVIRLCSPNQLQLKYLQLPYTESIKLLLVFDSLKQVEFSVTLSSLLVYLERLSNPVEFLICIHFLISYVESKDMQLNKIPSISLAGLVRLVGERLLTSHYLERDELTLIVVSKFLSIISGTFVFAYDENYKKDWYDMCIWLVKCGEQKLILTQSSIVEYCNFLIRFMTINDETMISNMQLKTTFLQSFNMASNVGKISLGIPIVTFMKSMNSQKQSTLYNEIFDLFEPQSSVEVGATYAIFFQELSRSSPHILIASLFNLLELSRFSFFSDYLKSSLMDYCIFMKLSGPKELFKSFKFDILRIWWKLDAIDQFPSHLFGYEDKEKFYDSNYRELIAISLSIRSAGSVSKRNRQDTNSFLNNLTLSKHASAESLVCDSLPLIIAMAYTKEGIRNGIFEVLQSTNPSGYKQDIKNKISIIVLEIIKHTDIPKESALLDSFYGSNIVGSFVCNPPVVIERFSDATISLNSSMDLLNKLVEKYSDPKKFWNTKQVYFFIRRISLLFKSAISTDQKILLLRKIKFIFALGQDDTIFDFKIVNLTIRLLCSLMKDEELCPEILVFMKAFRIQEFDRYPQEDSLPLLVHLLSRSLELKESGFMLTPVLIENIKTFLWNLESGRTVIKILNAASNILGQVETVIPTELIEGFLNDRSELVICTKDDDLNDVLSLVSSLFPFSDFLNEKYTIGNHKNIVKILLRARSDEYAKQSKEFNLWSGNYLAYFYLHGGLNEGSSSSIICSRKEHGHLQGLTEQLDLGNDVSIQPKGDVFEATLHDINNMDHTLKLIIRYLDDQDSEVAACAETIIGVLNYKYETSKREITKFIHPQVFLDISSYILPLDFHTCIILNDESEIDFLGDSLNDIIDNLDQFVNSTQFEVWSSRLFLALIQELAVYTSIAPLFSSFVVKVPQLSKDALPSFICFYINLVDEQLGVKMISRLFEEFSQVSSSSQETEKLFLKILLMIRVESRKASPKFEAVMNSINLSKYYKLAAKNKMFHTAIMLFEDWKCDTLTVPGKVQNQVSVDPSNLNDESMRRSLRSNPQSVVNPNFNDSAITSEDFDSLASIYKSIDNDDLVHGLPIKTTLDYALKIINERDQLIGSSDSLRFNSGLFDSEISLGKNSKNSNILHSMLKNGFIGVSKLIDNNMNYSGHCDDNYEWAWKLNRWELPIPRESVNENEAIYKTLKQIHDYPSRAETVCQEMFLDVLCNKNKLVNDSLSSKEFGINTLSWIKTIASISSIENVIKPNNLSLQNNRIASGSGAIAFPSSSNYPPLGTGQAQSISSAINSFNKLTSWFENSEISLSENILVARQVTFQILTEYPNILPDLKKSDKWLAVINELSRFNNISRISGETQKTISSTILLDEISKVNFTQLNGNLTHNVMNLSKYQAACSLWSHGQTSMPVLMLKDIEREGSGIKLPIDSLNIHSSIINSKLIAWMSDSRQDLASNIMDSYVLPTSGMVSSLTNLHEQAMVYQALAHFCEVQYKSRSLNEEIQKLEKRVLSKKQEIEELKSHYGKTSVPTDEKKAVQRFYVKLKHQLHAESADLQVVKSNREVFIKKSVEFYLKSISVADSNDENLDKFFSLWLEHSGKDELNNAIRPDVSALPSHKLISWSTQLISRLSSETSEFQDLLQSLIINFCVDHPHHTLYQLMSLRKHEKYSHDNTDSTIVSKYKAANKLWEELSHKSSALRDDLATIERFCNECVKLAEYKVSKGKTLHLDKLNIGTYWLDELPSIPPPTKSLSVDRSTMYKQIPRFQSTDSKVSIATSGLSLPKIATFQLSDGSKHRILLKHGTDDLRQDSIMEQVFEKVNHIFEKDKETRKRNLSIRTYKAVPIGPQSGIIEFVPNSVAFIDVVRPYHAKYDELKLEKAREMMKECQSGDKSERYKAYNKVTSKVHPTLRYFFFETFVTPDAWFQSRIAYTHGIATNSMVGHMLGLGDRHCNNILLDKHSGEPIHIDLGVAFDQGKRLPIPETVPFRLTRDLVDGFGVSGVEGVFKKSCEHTFRVLRANKDHIISILDVLRWDPLYSWALSPIRKKKIQDETTGWGNLQPQEDGSEAGRAVSMVSDKLVAGGLSVEAAVRELIQEATSPHNLALIYFGWCPFF